MLQKKKLSTLLATSVFLAACGGGGTDAPLAASPGTTTTNPTPGPVAPADPGTPPPTTTPPVTTPPVTTPPVTTPPEPGTPTTPPTPTPPVVLDQRLMGTMDMVATQIMYIRMNRIIYLPVHMSEFESDTGIVDVAPGSKVAHLDNLASEAAAAGCNTAIDGTCGVQPPAAAPAAPIAAFGIRVDKALHATAPGQLVANQTVVGRIAFDLTERNEAPGVGVGEVPEIMRFVIDNVEMSTDQNGLLNSVRVRDGAQIHVYGRNAAGVEVREDIPAPVGTVRLLPLDQVPDGKGDTSSIMLLMDLETGFSQAGQKLAALENIAGHFAMNVTLSSLEKIVRPAAPATSEFPAVSQKDLIGQPITVNNEPPVTGAGISGNAWIRMYPPR